MFYSGSLGYYAQLLALSYITGLQQGGHYQLAAGNGTFGYEPNVNYFFGFPRAIQTGGVAFDIPLITVQAMNDGDKEKRRQFVMQTGMLASALEHAVPEQLFADPNSATQPDAVSAVKALSKASAQGQQIYHLTQINQASALPNIHHDRDTMNEIRAALNAGKEVITHTDSISVPGWTGAGYIIFDPVTGDGAYKIAGGANGGFLKILDENLNKLLLWVESLSGSILSQYGGLFSQALAGLKGLYDQITTFIKLLKECPLATAIAGIVSFSLIVAGFVTASIAAFALNPIYGLIVASGGSVLASTVAGSFISSCRMRN